MIAACLSTHQCLNSVDRLKGVALKMFGLGSEGKPLGTCPKTWRVSKVSCDSFALASDPRGT